MNVDRLFFWKIGNEQKEIFTSNACIDSLLSRSGLCKDGEDPQHGIP